jgi:hypothetical protein
MRRPHRARGTCGTLSLVVGASILMGSSTASEQPQAQGLQGISTPAAVFELERLDNRTPLPLSPPMANHQKQNMREHLQAIEAIIKGLSRDDFATVEKSARAIGYSKEMERMCSEMGAGAPGFTERAIEFHKTADTIAEAARFKNRAGVLAALGSTLQTCTSCHATYRQQIVDSGAPGGMMHHHPKATP